MTFYTFHCKGEYSNEYDFTALVSDDKVETYANYLFKSFNEVDVINAETGEIVYSRYESLEIFCPDSFNFLTISDIISEIGFSNIYKYEVTVR